MKAKILSVGIWLISIQLMAQNNYSIAKREIDDPRLIKAIADYYTEYKEDLDDLKAAIVIRFVRSDTDKFYFAYKVYKIDVTRDPPMFYSFVNKKLILFYTGSEDYIQYNDHSCDQLFADGGEHLTESGVLYTPVVWEVVLRNDGGYTRKLVNQLPW